MKPLIYWSAFFFSLPLFSEIQQLAPNTVSVGGRRPPPGAVAWKLGANGVEFIMGQGSGLPAAGAISGARSGMGGIVALSPNVTAVGGRPVPRNATGWRLGPNGVEFVGSQGAVGGAGAGAFAPSPMGASPAPLHDGSPSFPESSVVAPGTSVGLPSGSPTLSESRPEVTPRPPRSFADSKFDVSFIPVRDQFNPDIPSRQPNPKQTGFQAALTPTEPVLGQGEKATRPYRNVAGAGSNLCSITLVDKWINALGQATCAYLTAGHCNADGQSPAQPVQIVSSAVTGRTVLAFSRNPEYRLLEGPNSSYAQNDTSLGFNSGKACEQAVKNTTTTPLCEGLPRPGVEESLFLASGQQDKDLELKTVFSRGDSLFDGNGMMAGLISETDTAIRGGDSGGAAYRRENGKKCIFGVVSAVAQEKQVNPDGSTVNIGQPRVLIQSGGPFEWAKAELARVRKVTEAKAVAAR